MLLVYLELGLAVNGMRGSRPESLRSRKESTSIPVQGIKNN
jgi:hypothetical protein